MASRVCIAAFISTIANAFEQPLANKCGVGAVGDGSQGCRTMNTTNGEAFVQRKSTMGKLDVSTDGKKAVIQVHGQPAIKSNDNLQDDPPFETLSITWGAGVESQCRYQCEKVRRVTCLRYDFDSTTKECRMYDTAEDKVVQRKEGWIKTFTIRWGKREESQCDYQCRKENGKCGRFEFNPSTKECTLYATDGPMPGGTPPPPPPPVKPSVAPTTPAVPASQACQDYPDWLGYGGWDCAGHDGRYCANGTVTHDGVGYGASWGTNNDPASEACCVCGGGTPAAGAGDAPATDPPTPAPPAPHDGSCSNGTVFDSGVCCASCQSCGFDTPACHHCKWDGCQDHSLTIKDCCMAPRPAGSPARICEKQPTNGWVWDGVSPDKNTNPCEYNSPMSHGCDTTWAQEWCAETCGKCPWAPAPTTTTQAFATLASAVTWKLGEPGASCDATCSLHGGTCAGNQEWLGWPESNEEIEQVAGYAGLTCSSSTSSCDMGECPLFFASSESSTNGTCRWCNIHGNTDSWRATYMPTCHAQATGRARLCPCDGVTPAPPTPAPTEAPTTVAPTQDQTFVDMYDNSACSGSPFKSVELSSSSEKLCDKCWDRCPHSGAKGFVLRGPGAAVVSWSCLGKFNYSNQGEFTRAGSAFTEGDGCHPVTGYGTIVLCDGGAVQPQWAEQFREACQAPATPPPPPPSPMPMGDGQMGDGQMGDDDYNGGTMGDK